MSRKNQSVVSAEVFIKGDAKYSEHEHLLEHVHFLEERTTDLEEKVEFLRAVFRDLLEDDEEEEDGEDEYEDEEESEESELNGHTCCCMWSRVASF